MQKLGLKRHTVHLVDHQEEWCTHFLEVKENLLSLLGKTIIDVQHVGSTAIPSIPAKPILDIAIAVKEMRLVKDIRILLESADYECRGDSRQDGGHLFVYNLAPDIRTQHIHIVLHSDSQWRQYLTFRDSLIANPEVAEEYMKLKQKLVQQYPTDRKAYTKGKHGFIQAVLAKADV